MGGSNVFVALDDDWTVDDLANATTQSSSMDCFSPTGWQEPNRSFIVKGNNAPCRGHPIFPNST